MSLIITIFIILVAIVGYFIYNNISSKGIDNQKVVYDFDKKDEMSILNDKLLPEDTYVKEELIDSEFDENEYFCSCDTEILSISYNEDDDSDLEIDLEETLKN